KIEKIESEVIRPSTEDVPPALRDNRLAAVLFRNTRDSLGAHAEDAAIAIDQVIRENAIVGWKENVDRQKVMRQGIDDYLFDLSERTGADWPIEVIDRVIDTSLERARAVL